MKNIWKAAVMLTLSALLLAAVWLAGLLAFSYFTLMDGEAASPTRSHMMRVAIASQTMALPCRTGTGSC